METGNLYRTKKFYWLFYRSEDDTDSTRSALVTHEAAKYWSTHTQNFPCIPPNSLFVLLEQKQKHCRVLSPKGTIGWIHLADWCRDDIEEVKAE